MENVISVNAKSKILNYDYMNLFLTKCLKKFDIKNLEPRTNETKPLILNGNNVEYKSIDKIDYKLLNYFRKNLARKKIYFNVVIRDSSYNYQFLATISDNNKKYLKSILKKAKEEQERNINFEKFKIIKTAFHDHKKRDILNKANNRTKD